MANEKNDSFIKKGSLKELVERYGTKDVVSTFEQSAKTSNIRLTNVNDLKLHFLFDEKNYSSESIAQLGESIKDKGFMFPLFVASIDNQLYVINGVKRFLASKMIKKEAVPTVLIDGEEKVINEYIINNMLMNNDNSLILAHAYNVLKTRYGLKEKDIREITGLSHGQINNTLRLDNLTKEIKSMLIKDELSYAKARLLVVLSSKDQVTFAKKFIAQNLNVRECERLVREYIEGESYFNNTPIEEKEKDSVVAVVKEDSIEIKNLDYKSKEELIKYLEGKGIKCL